MPPSTTGASSQSWGSSSYTEGMARASLRRRFSKSSTGVSPVMMAATASRLPKCGVAMNTNPSTGGAPSLHWARNERATSPPMLWHTRFTRRFPFDQPGRLVIGLAWISLTKATSRCAFVLHDNRQSYGNAYTGDLSRPLSPDTSFSYAGWSISTARLTTSSPKSTCPSLSS